MNTREQELVELKKYIDNVDKETSLLLQNLQWDHKHLIESPAMVSCKYVAEHRIPLHSVEAHEKQCYLSQEGYNTNDVLLPDPINPNADTVIKLSKHDIVKVINTAASLDPLFKRGSGSAEPLSVERLQYAYSADERRAIHDAVVAAAPTCHDLADLALASCNRGLQASKMKSRAEILAELRDMKRRRTRYRVTTKTAKYSDVLRDVIKTQMELYAEAKGIFIKTEYGENTNISVSKPIESTNYLTDIVVKQERPSPDTDNYRHSESDRSMVRKHRKGYEDREIISSRKQDNHGTENDSDRKYKDISQHHYSKERRIYEYNSHSKREHRIKDTLIKGSSRQSSSQTEASTSKHATRYSENDRKQNKYDDGKYMDSYKSTSKYESSYKEHDKHRSYREDSSKYSKYDRKRKCDEKHGHRNYSKVYREEKHIHYYTDQIKKEKEDYREGSNDEGRKQYQRH